jgi:hypothetical protein
MQTAHVAILVAVIAVLGAASYLCVPHLGLGAAARAKETAAAAAATEEALHALETQLTLLQQDVQNKIAIANMVAAQQEAKIQHLANSLYGNVLRRAQQQQQQPVLQAGPSSAQGTSSGSGPVTGTGSPAPAPVPVPAPTQ